MREIGRRLQPPVGTPDGQPSSERFMAGLRFNDECHRLQPIGWGAFIPKGVYRFRDHAEANRQQQEATAKLMAYLACQRGRI